MMQGEVSVGPRRLRPGIPSRGLTVVEIMDAAHAGRIKGMYILGENPAMSDPDLDHARAGLWRKLDHLVVQDIFLTETANYADVILPASAFAEKTGTVTNTNRQVQMGRPAVPPRAKRRRIGGSRSSLPAVWASIGLMAIPRTCSPR